MGFERRLGASFGVLFPFSDSRPFFGVLAGPCGRFSSPLFVHVRHGHFEDTSPPLWRLAGPWTKSMDAWRTPRWEDWSGAVYSCMWVRLPPPCVDSGGAVASHVALHGPHVVLALHVFSSRVVLVLRVFAAVILTWRCLFAFCGLRVVLAPHVVASRGSGASRVRCLFFSRGSVVFTCAVWFCVSLALALWSRMPSRLAVLSRFVLALAALAFAEWLASMLLMGATVS